jgi:DNA-binding CsgD family transcriptional regulator
MAEYFVIERGTLANDRKVLESGASRVLSPREFQIARLLEAGRTRPSIAQELGLTPNTVASLSKIIYRKLDVRSRAELVARMRLS